MGLLATLMMVAIHTLSACDKERAPASSSAEPTTGSGVEGEPTRSIKNYNRYMIRTMRSEAQAGLQRLGEGALIFAQTEHADAAGNLLPLGFPLAKKPVCTSTGGSGREPVAPRAKDFTESVFNRLHFELRRPHRYRFCYQSADGSTFKAWAEASLINTNDSRFEITGDMASGQPTISPLNESVRVLR